VRLTSVLGGIALTNADLDLAQSREYVGFLWGLANWFITIAKSHGPG
jgi:hypothetical protein